MSRPGFMVYFNDFIGVMQMDDAMVGRFFRLAFDYARTGNIPVLTGLELALFTTIRARIDIDEDRYDETSIKRRYGGYCRAEKAAGREPVDLSTWQHMQACASISSQFNTNSIPIQPNNREYRPDFSDEKPDALPPKAKKRTYPHESTPYRAAAALARLMTENTPAMKPPGEATLQTWADSFRLLNERDGYDWDLINAVLVWCQDDPFWQKNILSGPTFRKQFGKLLVQMEASKR